MKKIIHIHVGKCAGGTINNVLAQTGIEITELHCFSANKDLIDIVNRDDGCNLYLIGVRDPIARFVSAFNFDKYEILTSQKSGNHVWDRIYNEFPSVDHLVQSLLSMNHEKRTLAWDAISNSALHIQMGLSWYLEDDILDRIPKDRLNVIRTEMLELDMIKFLRRYGLHLENIIFDKDKDSSKFLDKIGIKNPSFLSDISKIILSEILKRDYQIINWFYNHGLIDNEYSTPMTVTPTTLSAEH